MSLSDWLRVVHPPTVDQRAAVHAALGDPMRLAIVDELHRSDRSPKELGARFGLAGNLLAHHLDALERVDLIERFVSSGDRRRRYVRLRAEPLRRLDRPHDRPEGVVFVCTHNSARSQLAAALWHQLTGDESASAGTHPAASVHPGAVAAGRRAGLDLHDARPRHFEPASTRAHVVTVCDRAHEELDVDDTWWHWSIPDPVDDGTPAAFDRALTDLSDRISAIVQEDRP